MTDTIGRKDEQECQSYDGQLDHIVSTWPKDRRKELSLMLDVLQILDVLDQGSGFLHKIQFCIDTAKKLNRSDVESGRSSFAQFLISKANNDEC